MHALEQEFHKAVVEGDLAGINDFLNQNSDFDPNIWNDDGETALFITIKNANITDEKERLALIQRLLLHASIDPNKGRNTGFTPLMLATLSGKNTIVEELIKHKGINACATFDGNNILVYAQYNQNIKTFLKTQLKRHIIQSIQMATDKPKEEQMQEQVLYLYKNPQDKQIEYAVKIGDSLQIKKISPENLSREHYNQLVISLSSKPQTTMLAPKLKSGLMQLLAKDGYIQDQEIRDPGAQRWLIAKMQSLRANTNTDIYGNNEGVCLGLSYMAMIIILENQEQNYERLDNILQRIQNISIEHFPIQMEYVANKRRLNIQKLTESEQIDLDIINFLDGIEIFQSITKHPEIQQRKQPLANQDPDAVLPLILPSTFEEKEDTIARAGNLIGVYDNENKLEEYLSSLQKQFKSLKGSTFPIACQLSASQHVISIYYIPSNGNWYCIDANNKTPAQKITDITQLTNFVWGAFRLKDKVGMKQQGLTLTTGFYTTKSNKYTLANQIELLKKQIPISKEISQIIAEEQKNT